MTTKMPHRAARNGCRRLALCLKTRIVILGATDSAEKQYKLWSSNRTVLCAVFSQCSRLRWYALAGQSKSQFCKSCSDQYIDCSKYSQLQHACTSLLISTGVGNCQEAQTFEIHSVCFQATPILPLKIATEKASPVCLQFAKIDHECRPRKSVPHYHSRNSRSGF